VTSERKRSVQRTADGRFEIRCTETYRYSWRDIDATSSWTVVDTANAKRPLKRFRGTSYQHKDSDGDINTSYEGVVGVTFSPDERELVVRDAKDVEKRFDLLALAEPSRIGKALGE
jgi:hypothetical protein